MSIVFICRHHRNWKEGVNTFYGNCDTCPGFYINCQICSGKRVFSEAEWQKVVKNGYARHYEIVKK